MDANDIPTVLYSILLVGGAIFGALNLQLYITTYKKVRELERQNKELRLRLLECENKELLS